MFYSVAKESSQGHRGQCLNTNGVVTDEDQTGIKLLLKTETLAQCITHEFTQNIITHKQNSRNTPVYPDTTRVTEVVLRKNKQWRHKGGPPRMTPSRGG